MKVIYEMSVGETLYIGSTNNLKRRINYHRYLLKTNTHFNEKLQTSYNLNNKIEYRVLEETEDWWDTEAKYIDSYREKGIDIANVSGGAGMRGLKRGAIFREVISRKMSAENNSQSKLTNEDFFDIVDYLKDGLTNSEIAEKYNLHPNYISLIRHKRRFASLWKYTDYEVVKSSGRSKITYDDFVEILELYSNSNNMQKIADFKSMDRSVVSRIVNKKTYLDYWEKYEGSSTTIETTVPNRTK